MPEALFGGGSQQQSSQSGGFNDLPAPIKDNFIEYARDNLKGFFPTTGNRNSTQYFTPMGVTQPEQTALNNINQGFAPTASSINNDIAMQQNPYNDYVISEINRQSQGQNSVLQQNLNTAGQFGSNRQFLGANDIDLSRMNQIGQFLQGQFDTSLNNALTTLPQARQQDAQNQLNGGQFLRGLDFQTKQAPVQALLTAAQAMGILPQSAGGGSSSSSGSQNTGVFSPIKLFG